MKRTMSKFLFLIFFHRGRVMNQFRAQYKSITCDTNKKQQEQVSSRAKKLLIKLKEDATLMQNGGEGGRGGCLQVAKVQQKSFLKKDLIHTHSLPPSLTLYLLHTLSLSLSIFYTLFLSLSLYLLHTLSLSLSHTLSHSVGHSHSHSAQLCARGPV